MLKNLTLGVGMCALIFVIVEGISSVVFVAYTLLSPQAPGRELSGPQLQYDSELGWVSVPNYFQKNYFAPGAWLKTNSRGFRNEEETTDRVPPGKLRVVCSGDSATFGDGVANDRSWCPVLERLDSRLQAVNMAVIGYGADQMYLRYKRSGAALDRDVHLFAVVTDSFRRMHYTAMGGYGKPVLTLRNGEIATASVSPARGSALQHFLALKPNPLRQFRFVTVVADALDRARSHPMVPEVPTDEERRIVLKLLDNLAAMEKSRNSVLGLVYLLTRHEDYAPGGPSDLWRRFLRTESANRGVVFIDLVEDFQKLPVTAQDGMFIWPGFTEYFAESQGHYDEQGHDYLARQVYARLLAAPVVAGKLARLSAVTSQPTASIRTRVALSRTDR